MLESAQASSRLDSLVASESWRRSSAPTRETFITQTLGSTSLRRLSGEQEWSPASAGQAPRSRQDPSYPPSGVLHEFFSGWEPAVADFHIRAITSCRAGLSRSSAAAEMSRCSG